MGNCWAAQAKSSLSLEEVFPNGQSGGDNGLSDDLKKEFPNGQSGSGNLDEVFQNGQSGSDNGLSGGLKKEFPNWQSGSGNLDELFPNGQILPTSNLRAFSFSELEAATRNFWPDNVVSEGVFGTVYKGWVDEKMFVPTETGHGLRTIAVKKLNFGWKYPKKRTFRTSGRVRIVWRVYFNPFG